MLISLLGLGGLAAFAGGVVTLGLSDAHHPEFLATWVSVLAGFFCLSRSGVHIGWGKYLTRRPAGPPRLRRVLLELNLLVPANVLLCVVWIWIASVQLTKPAPQPPAIVAIVLATAIVVVAMETVRCVKVAGKRRGTEIVCQGPIGEWFRDLFETSSEDSGFVHKAMLFFRFPNRPTQVSRFLCLLAALMIFPTPVHGSSAGGQSLHRILFQPPEPISGGENRSRREGDATPEDDPGGEEVEEDDDEAECGGAYDAAPAPAVNREQIVALFKDAGMREAGCPRAAEPVAGEDGVWIAPAYCGSKLRSLAVTAPNADYLPALVYQQAADFALARAREGILLGASARHPIRGGDFYVIDTTLGSFVLIRRRSSTGRLPGSEAGGGSCVAYTSGNVTYTVVPPGLVGLWLDATEEGEWLFPHSTSASGEGEEFEFLTEYPASESLAGASCSSDLRCTLRVDDEVRRSSGRPRYVSVVEITSLAG